MQYKTHQQDSYPTRSSRSCAILATVLASLGATAAPAWGQVIYEDIKLLASDGVLFDTFGSSIAIDNGVVAVGARGDDDRGGQSGSAYLFDASTGAPLAKLTANDGAASDDFGRSIAIDNDVVVVGAPLHDDRGGDSGSAYVFSASTGGQMTKLLASDGSAFDWFGWSIAIDGGIIAVGAPFDDDNGDESGSAYLFDATTGSQIAKLLPSDGSVGKQFGRAIAIDNGVVAVGAYYEKNNGVTSGAVYLFDASSGAQLHKLFASDGQSNDWLGYSVAIDNGIVAAGTGGNNWTAYTFDASTGAQLAKLVSDDGLWQDRFGRSIAIDDGVVAVGAYQHDDNGGRSGSAYLFEATTGTQIAELLASDGSASDEFGWSIAIESGIVAVGTRWDDDKGEDSGSAYVFTVPETSCQADLNGDGVINVQDFVVYLNAWTARDPLADWNDDGRIDTRDFLAYLNDWVAGC